MRVKRRSLSTNPPCRERDRSAIANLDPRRPCESIGGAIAAVARFSGRIGLAIKPLHFVCVEDDASGLASNS